MYLREYGVIIIYVFLEGVEIGIDILENSNLTNMSIFGDLLVLYLRVFTIEKYIYKCR